MEAVNAVIVRHGKSNICNTDQRSRFTSIGFIKTLQDATIAISMVGKAAWRDNVFVELLWKIIKYEEIYLHAYRDVPEARTAIGRHLDFYNIERSHSSLDGQSPDQAYFNSLQPIPAAA